MTKLPDRITLHNQAKRDDQRRRLQRRQDVKSDRSHDEPERKAGKACNKRACESCDEENREMKRGPIHMLAPKQGRAALEWDRHLMGRLRLPQMEIILYPNNVSFKK